MARARKPIPDYLDCPFRPIVDSNETLGYHFKNITRRHSSGILPLVVETVSKPLWSTDRRDVTVGRGKRQQTHFVGYADYSIDGIHDKIQIERKTLEDLFGTIGGRHSRFEAEIKRLHEDCEAAYVMVEATLGQISVFNTDASEMQFHDEESGGFGDDDVLSFNVDTRPRFGKTRPEVVLGTIASWGLKYRNVHWIFADNRSMAEMLTFNLLAKYWDKHIESCPVDNLF